MYHNTGPNEVATFPFSSLHTTNISGHYNLPLPPLLSPPVPYQNGDGVKQLQFSLHSLPARIRKPPWPGKRETQRNSRVSVTGSRLSAFAAPLITRLFLSASQQRKALRKDFWSGIMKQLCRYWWGAPSTHEGRGTRKHKVICLKI